jgi:SAM-dependent methyltransferase
MIHPFFAEERERIVLICPVCSKTLLIHNPRACENCGWVETRHNGIVDYLGPIEDQPPVLREYLENYNRVAEDDLRNNIMDANYVKNQASNLIRLIGSVKGCNVADIGSGKGYLVSELLKRGASRVTAVDIALPYLCRLEKNPRVHLVRANSENLPFQEEFDVIVSTDVMEHVLNLGSFLHSINRALKKGGKFGIRVPYREDLLSYSTLLGCPYRFVHLRGFNRGLLKDCLERAGFKVKRFSLDGFGFGMPQGFWTRGIVRPRLYNLIRSRAESRMEHPADVACWKSIYARLLLRPITISATGYKNFNIRPRPGCGFELN